MATSDRTVIVTGGKGEKGDKGDLFVVDAHATLTDLDTSGHPASVIAAAGPAGWTTAQEAIDGLHALAVALGAADATEASAREAADTAEVTARNAAISAAVNALVNGAPGLLDTLGEIATALAGDDDAIAALTTAVNARATQVALNAENTRALSAEGALDDAIGDETDRATAAEATKATTAALASETTRATTAEGTLTSNLAAEVTRATTAEASKATTAALSAEASTRAAADTAEVTARNAAISAAVNALVNGAPGVLDTLAEIAAALGDDDSAIAALTTAVNARATQAALDSETTARTAADTANASAITTETTRATTAEGQLVPKSLFTGSNRILSSTAVDTPSTVTISSSQLVGRHATSNVIGLTMSQVKLMLGYLASDIANTPGNGIAATTVQAAITELATAVTATVSKYAVAIGDGSASVFNVDHNLGTMDVTAVIWEDKLNGERVRAEMALTTVNRLTVTFVDYVPLNGEFRVVVTG